MNRLSLPHRIRRLGSRLTRRTADATLAALALTLAVELRMGGQLPPAMAEGVPLAATIAGVVTALTFSLAGVYRRPWRYFTAVDLLPLLPVTLVAVVAGWVVVIADGRGDWLPQSVPIIQWFVLLALVCGLRLLRRLRWDSRDQGLAPAPGAPTSPQAVLLVGSIGRIEAVLRTLTGSHGARFRPVGILDRDGRDIDMRVRGVPVLGTPDALEEVVNRLDAEGQRPGCLMIVEGPEPLPGPERVRLVARAEVLGLNVSRIVEVVGIDDRAGEIDLRFIDMAALLGRPQTPRDPAMAREAIAGRRVLVTGAGGSIGSELARQIAALDPAELVLVDHCEFNLYSIDLELQENFPTIGRAAVLCSIRQRAALDDVFARHRPELVFHAAALKHVPLVELNPCAGVLTNVLGTRNVADAARRFGARAMVQVSTDKAVNPVGVMGATKRLGELYCQALDLAGAGQPGHPRFVTVRFGNVLGSSGSLIPLFQRQLARRVPLTVTHPEITRFFMTIHEAVHLILGSTAEALRRDVGRGRIFVLDMGEPVKIIDIARRMIRLAGLEPDVDVKIDIVGLRPGEKLYEELFDRNEQQLGSQIPGIMEALPAAIGLGTLDRLFNRLEQASIRGEAETVRQLLCQATGETVPAEAATLPPRVARPPVLRVPDRLTGAA